MQQHILLGKLSFLDRNSVVSVVSCPALHLCLLVRLFCSMCTKKVFNLLYFRYFFLLPSPLIYFNLERDPNVLRHTSIAFNVINPCVFATYTIRRTNWFSRNRLSLLATQETCAAEQLGSGTMKGESCDKPRSSFQQTLESQACWGSYWHSVGEFYTVFSRKEFVIVSEKCDTFNFCVAASPRSEDC